LKRLCCLTYSDDPRKETDGSHDSCVLGSSVVARSLLFVVLMSVARTGFRIAVLTGANLDDDSREQIAASRSLGILLSFVLGFTLAVGQALLASGLAKVSKNEGAPT
jgi:high-affinity Fe2+/Pb2+ permease